MRRLKDQIAGFYERHQTRVDMGFFLGGFAFDVVTLTEVDDLFGIIQQVVLLLYRELLESSGLWQIPPRWQKSWVYRRVAFHFLLGSLLSLYSLFFLKSSSFFSSLVFVGVLVGLMVANELKHVQEGRVGLRVSVYIMCLLSFFSIVFPLLLGFVGLVPTALALAATGLCVMLIYRKLRRRVSEAALDPTASSSSQRWADRALRWPAAGTLAVFVMFYLVGWIPPVPLSVQEMGIYHDIRKSEGDYFLYHENPWWRFWKKGDQDFKAQKGDRIHFFARVFSPARFSDAVVLHWFYKDAREGWKSTDRIPMKITGGRQGGYRGFAVKQNYQPGEWRVSVETTDRREMGRLYFTVEEVPADPLRTFTFEIR